MIYIVVTVYLCVFHVLDFVFKDYLHNLRCWRLKCPVLLNFDQPVICTLNPNRPILLSLFWLTDQLTILLAMEASIIFRGDVMDLHQKCYIKYSETYIIVLILVWCILLEKVDYIVFVNFCCCPILNIVYKWYMFVLFLIII